MQKYFISLVSGILLALTFVVTLAFPCFAAEESAAHTIALTDEEKAWLSRNGEISIAIDTSWAPYGFAGNDGHCEGIIPNIMQMVADRAGLSVTFVAVPSYANAIAACSTGETTLLSGVANDTRMSEANGVLLTAPYIEIGYSAVTSANIVDLYAEGVAYRVAICTGTYAKIAMQDKMPGYTFVEYHSNEECMDAVLQGEADIALVANYSAGYFSHWHTFDKLQVIQINDFNWELCFGVNANADPLLVSILNKSIATLSENDVNQAIYAGATEAASAVHRMSDIFYEQPFFVAGCSAVLAGLTALVIFLFLLQKRKAAAWRREQELHRKTEDALQQARQASESKTEFFSRMSHDMRTPMNGILGMVELSEDETDLPTLKKNLGKIKSSGQYLLRLINDTLDLQKIESGKLRLEPQVVYTKDLLENTVGMVRAAAEKKGITFKVDMSGISLDNYLRVDALRMKQIFVNLLSNAVKFTPQGGTVALGLRLDSKNEKFVCAVITVTDTGIGMSHDFLEHHIFQPFAQEYNVETVNYAGTGLGLSIAKSLVELMSGHISVESELGGGTCFTVQLPLERADATTLKQTTEQNEQQRTSALEVLRGKRILLAEDHPLNAEIAQKLLKKSGCAVAWAKNGKECVEMLTAPDSLGFDLILMDIRMPVMDGIAASRAIRNLSQSRLRNIPIVAMTANAYASDVTMCLEAGMNAHIPKPIEPLTMYRTIADVMKKSTLNQ